MADWLDIIIKALLNLGDTDPGLVSDIRLTVKKIESNPLLGKYIRETRYSYTDPHYRFRIGYNHHPKNREIEIVTLHLIRSRK